MREILIKPSLHKFETFSEFSQEFALGAKDLVFTNEFIYTPFMKKLNLACTFVFQEKFGSGEPTEEMLEAILDEMEGYSFDRIIAIGGGAIMDISKIISLKRTGSVHDIFFKKAEVVREKELIAIPTTCGTGSEVTEISVAIVKDDTGKTTKLGLVSETLIPNTVCIVPELLSTLPYKPFAASALDALIHAVESYLSPSRATMTSELFGVRAMELILKGFKLIKKGGPEARLPYLDEFVTASLYAGIAFLQAGCATVHAMSFPLGGTHHVPHGESNYVLFAKVLEKYDTINPEGKIAEFKKVIARILGGSEKDAISTLCDIMQIVFPLKPLHEYGMTEDEIQTFADSVLANQQRLVVNSYVPLTRDLIVEIYTECF